MKDVGPPVNLTATALASLAGVSVSTAWRWIEGVSRPSPLARRRLAEKGVRFVRRRVWKTVALGRTVAR